MSGGSYNYLCHAGLDDLFNKTEDIRNMADRLSGLGYAKDAARETEELLLVIRQAETRIELMSERLSNVWRSIEWWDSSDSCEDSVIKALEEYRRK